MSREEEEEESEYNDKNIWTYKQLQAECKSREIRARGTRDHLIELLEDYDQRVADEAEAKENDIIETPTKQNKSKKKKNNKNSSNNKKTKTKSKINKNNKNTKNRKKSIGSDNEIENDNDNDNDNENENENDNGSGSGSGSGSDSQEQEEEDNNNNNAGRSSGSGTESQDLDMSEDRREDDMELLNNVPVISEGTFYIRGQSGKEWKKLPAMGLDSTNFITCITESAAKKLKLLNEKCHESWLMDFVTDTDNQVIETSVLMPVDMTLKHHIPQNNKNNKTKTNKKRSLSNGTANNTNGQSSSNSQSKRKLRSQNNNNNNNNDNSTSDDNNNNNDNDNNGGDIDIAESMSTRTWFAIIDSGSGSANNVFGTLAASQFDIDYSFQKNSLSYQLNGESLDSDAMSTKFLKEQMEILPNMYPKGYDKQKKGKEWKTYKQMKKIALDSEKVKNQKRKNQKTTKKLPMARWLLYPRS